MTSYGYIIMVIVDSCMIWFQFDCTMQLKKLYHIATNVCSRKSATTFGDLPDCLSTSCEIGRKWMTKNLIGLGIGLEPSGTKRLAELVFTHIYVTWCH